MPHTSTDSGVLKQTDNPLDTFKVVELADYYNTSVDYLLGRTDEIAPYPKAKDK